MSKPVFVAAVLVFGLAVVGRAEVQLGVEERGCLHAG